MTQEELQTLLDIGSSRSFDELKSRTASRLGALQQSIAADIEIEKTGCSGYGCYNRSQPYGMHMCQRQNNDQTTLTKFKKEQQK